MKNKDGNICGEGQALKNIRSTKPPHILLAEDDEEMRRLLALLLRKQGCRVTECPDGIALLDQLNSFFIPGEKYDAIDLIISDIRLPGLTGMEVLMAANGMEAFPPMILITAFGDEETHEKAKGYGAVAIFDKPFDFDNLANKVDEILRGEI